MILKQGTIFPANGIRTREGIYTALVGILLLVGCNRPGKLLVAEGKETWGTAHATDTTLIQQEWEVYIEGNDTLTYYTNYYTNGKLKSKVVMKNSGLWQIELVLDTLGKKQNVGSFRNGNGCVTEYRSDNGNPECEGCYVDGNKEGWWKNYQYTGSIIDSTLYKEGIIQRPTAENELDVLLDFMGPVKDNLYH